MRSLNPITVSQSDSFLWKTIIRFSAALYAGITGALVEGLVVSVLPLHQAPLLQLLLQLGHPLLHPCTEQRWGEVRWETWLLPFSCNAAVSFSSSARWSLSTSLFTTFITRDLAAWSTPVVSSTAETDTTNSESWGPSPATCWAGSSGFLGEFLSRFSSRNKRE